MISVLEEFILLYILVEHTMFKLFCNLSRSYFCQKMGQQSNYVVHSI